MYEIIFYSKKPYDLAHLAKKKKKKPCIDKQQYSYNILLRWLRRISHTEKNLSIA